MDKITFIPEDELEDRRVYRVRSRNLRFAVWDAKQGVFWGIREKFGSTYIDYEIQWRDSGGTARAEYPLDFSVSREVPLKDVLYLACKGCGGKTESVWVADDSFYSGQKCTGATHIDPAEREACELEGTYCQQWIANMPLYEFMMQVEADNDDVPWRMP